jgi:hypothetical protein
MENQKKTEKGGVMIDKKKNIIISDILNKVDRWMLKSPEPPEFETIKKNIGKKKIEVTMQNANEHDDKGKITWVETGVGINVNGKNIFFNTYSESEADNIERDVTKNLKKVI